MTHHVNKVGIQRKWEMRLTDNKMIKELKTARGHKRVFDTAKKINIFFEGMSFEFQNIIVTVILKNYFFLYLLFFHFFVWTFKFLIVCQWCFCRRITRLALRILIFWRVILGEKIINLTIWESRLKIWWIQK